MAQVVCSESANGSSNPQQCCLCQSMGITSLYCLSSCCLTPVLLICSQETLDYFLHTCDQKLYTQGWSKGTVVGPWASEFHYRKSLPLESNPCSIFSLDHTDYAQSMMVCISVFSLVSSGTSRMLQARCWTAGPLCPEKRRSSPCSSSCALVRPSPLWSWWRFRRRRVRQSRFPHPRQTPGSGHSLKATTEPAAQGFWHIWKTAALPAFTILKIYPTASPSFCPSSTSTLCQPQCLVCPPMACP